MTTDEKRQQKAMLLLDLSEAEEDFAHLMEKAKRFKDRLTQMVDVLDNAHAGIKTDMRQRLELAVGKASDLAANAPQSSPTDAAALNELMVEIQAARKRVAELQTRKAELGLK